VEFYVTPVLPELTVDLDGMKEGEYTVDITQITNFTKKKFSVRSTATENTTDDLIFEDENLKFRNMEKDKSYNLTIGYEDATTGEESEFEVVEVKTSEKEQSVAVDDWEKLDEAEEKPVTFTEGDKEVKVKEGTTGEEIEDLLEEEPVKFPWGAVGAMFLVLVIAVGITTESGRYRFFLSVMTIMTTFTHLTKEDIERDIGQQNLRGMIYQHIKENPETHYSTIKKTVGAANGTLCYHLDVLQKMNYVRSRSVLGKKYYWTSEQVFPEMKKYPKGGYPPLDEGQKEIVSALESGKSLTVKEIHEMTAIPRSTLDSKLQPMVIFGMVSKEWGLPSRYSLNKEYEKYYLEYKMKLEDL